MRSTRASSTPASATARAQKAAADLIREGREQLLNPPRTTLGTGKGRLNDIGPLVLGRRLNTSKTLGAYQALIYQKGALVLRMLHFLMSDPATTNDAGFVAMMTDFVDKYRNGAATTEQFAAVAGQHFANTPIGRKFQLRDLNWFFSQWVYGTELPTYTLEYELKPNADGSLHAQRRREAGQRRAQLDDGAAGGDQLRRQPGGADHGARDGRVHAV